MAVLEHRHQLLRIEFGERGRVLLATVADQMHRHGLVSLTLEIERDADAIDGAGAPESVQPKHICSHGLALRGTDTSGERRQRSPARLARPASGGKRLLPAAPGAMA